MKDFMKKQVVLIGVVCCIRTILVLDLYFTRIRPAGADMDNAALWGFMIALPLIIFAICYRNKKLLQIIGSTLLIIIWWFVIFLVEVYSGVLPWLEKILGVVLFSDTDQVAGLAEVFYLFWIFIVSVATIVVKAIVSLFLIIRQNQKKKKQKCAES